MPSALFAPASVGESVASISRATLSGDTGLTREWTGRPVARLAGGSAPKWCCDNQAYRGPYRVAHGPVVGAMGMRACPSPPRARSSTAEQGTFNPLVPGSNPGGLTRTGSSAPHAHGWLAGGGPVISMP